MTPIIIAITRTRGFVKREFGRDAGLPRIAPDVVAAISTKKAYRTGK